VLYLLLLLTEIFILFLLSRSVSKAISGFLSINFIFLIFLPGIILHELAHFLAATILFVPTGEMEMMPRRVDSRLQLGSIKIAQTDPLRRFIIGLAPVFLGMIIVIGLSYLFILNYSSLLTINIYLFLCLVFFLVYIQFAVCNTMFSSGEDMKGAVELLIFVIMIITVLRYLNFGIPVDFFIKIYEGIFLKTVQASIVFALIPICIDTITLLLFEIIAKRR
jgi:hypothetical protein